jgi:mRNA interferase HigB
MRIIAKRTLREFWAKHPLSETPLKVWYDVAKQANWVSPRAIKIRYRTASFVADHLVVFNIKGDSYRLVVSMNYAEQIIFIKFIGTHSEYDKIDVTTI